MLKRLQDRQLIDRTNRVIGGPDAGSGAFAYFLTRQGSKAIAVATQSVAVHREAPKGTHLLRHALAAADIALAFQTTADARAAHELLLWESDWEIRQPVAGGAIVPDAFLIYATETTELHAYVEVDLGTEGSRAFMLKVDRYLRLYESGTWQQTLELWPIILTVTPTKRRSDLLKRSTETVLRSRPNSEQLIAETEFAFAQIDELLGRSPLDPIWQFAFHDGTHQLLPEDPKEV